MAITITEQDIANAKSYVKIMDKEKWCRINAPLCIDRVTIAAKEGNTNLPMPALFKENPQRKSRYLMGAFAQIYLRHEIDPCKDGSMAADDYDRYAGSHIFNQMERMKSKPSVRDKVFDILSDYKDLEKRLNTEIYSLLQIQNDSVSRQMAFQQAALNPETLQRSIEEFNALTEQIDAYKAKKAMGAGEHEEGH